MVHDGGGLPGIPGIPGLARKALAVQVVLRLADTPAEVVLGFDLAPCKAAIWFGEDGGLRVRAAASWFEAVRRAAFAVPIAPWSTSSPPRVLKYCARGFDVLLPGVRRAFVPGPSFGDAGITRWDRVQLRMQLQDAWAGWLGGGGTPDAERRGVRGVAGLLGLVHVVL